MDERKQYTVDELGEMTVKQVQKLYAQGSIEPWQLGAAVARIAQRRHGKK